MPETAVDHPVLVHFRQKDPKTGTSVTYDPNGEDGWPGAVSVWPGVPGSPEAQHLLDGDDSHHGPLIGAPIEEPKPAAPRATAKTADSKES